MKLYKYCRRCGKRLKGEENRRRGYGKTCFQHARKSQEDRMHILVPFDTLPIEIITEPKGEERENLQGEARQKGTTRAKAKEFSAQEQSKAQGSEPSKGQSIKAKHERKGQSMQILQRESETKGLDPHTLKRH